MEIGGKNIDVGVFLQSMSSSDIYYCPNPGNAGDSAIATATYQLFDRVGLRYHCVGWDEDFDSEGKSIVYGGGGNLTDNYLHARTFIERHHAEAERFIMLPHTVQGNSDLLRDLGPNVYLFCRERRSFEWVREHAGDSSVYLDHDLAFRLDPDTVLEEPFTGAEAIKTVSNSLARSVPNSLMMRLGIDSDITGPTLPLRKAARASKDVLSTLTGSKSVLYALRTDKERTVSSPPSSNVDVSRVFSYGTTPPLTAKRATVGMLSFFDCYERVVTNRLHGCILAALLGKEVDFYANNYFKNREVYLHSIEGQFPNVRWCGEWEEKTDK